MLQELANGNTLHAQIFHDALHQKFFALVLLALLPALTQDPLLAPAKCMTVSVLMELFWILMAAVLHMPTALMLLRRMTLHAPLLLLCQLLMGATMSVMLMVTVAVDSSAVLMDAVKLALLWLLAVLLNVITLVAPTVVVVTAVLAVGVLTDAPLS